MTSWKDRISAGATRARSAASSALRGAADRLSGRSDADDAADQAIEAQEAAAAQRARAEANSAAPYNLRELGEALVRQGAVTDGVLGFALPDGGAGNAGAGGLGGLAGGVGAGVGMAGAGVIPGLELLTPDFQPKPIAGGDAISKADGSMVLSLGPAAKGPKAIYWDPFTTAQQLGFRDRPPGLTMGMLAYIVARVPIIQALIQLRVQQVAVFGAPVRNRFDTGFRVRMRDPQARPTRADTKMMRALEGFISTCGVVDHTKEREGFEQFLKKYTRDSLIYDQAASEVVLDRQGRPIAWHAVDSATIRLADTSKLQPDENVDAVRYVQIYDSVVVKQFSAREMMFMVRNPRTDIRFSDYGTSEIEMAVSAISALLNALNYNANFFNNGTVAKGLLNLKGAIPEKQLRAFRRAWYQMVSGTSSAFRTPITNAEEIQWINMQSCVAGSTQVWTNRGAAPISSLAGGQHTVWTGQKWACADAFATSLKPLCITTLSDGSRLETSPDHKFLSVNNEGSALVFKRQSELRHGDFVALNARAYEGAEKLPRLNGSDVGPALIEALGWALGDGYFALQGRGAGKYNRVRWFYGPHELAVREKHRAALAAHGFEGQLEDRALTPEDLAHRAAVTGLAATQASSHAMRVDSVELSAWLTSCGFQSSADSKIVPAALFGCSAEIRAALLRGLFSADGSNHARRNPILACHDDVKRASVRALLLSLGIRCNASEGTHVADVRSGERRPGKHYLKVKDREAFFARVGFCAELAHKAPDAKPERSGLSDRVPRATSLYFLRAIQVSAGYAQLNELDRKRLCEIFGGRSECSRTRLLEFARKADFSLPAWLCEYNFEAVVEIDRTDDMVQMYDLTVRDESHQYTANGVVTHNSNRDMEFNSYIDFLIKIVCGMYLTDPIEIGFKYGAGGSGKSMFESANRAKSQESRERGLRPILRGIAREIDRNIIHPIAPEFSIDFVGLESQTPKELADLTTQRARTIYTINELRAENDLEPLGELGDIILDANWMNARSQKIARADAAAAAAQTQVQGIASALDPKHPANAAGPSSSPGGAAGIAASVAQSLTTPTPKGESTPAQSPKEIANELPSAYVEASDREEPTLVKSIEIEV